MATPQAAPETQPPARETSAVWLPRELIQNAKVIAAHREQSLASVVAEMLRGPLEWEYRKVVAEMDAAANKKG